MSGYVEYVHADIQAGTRTQRQRSENDLRAQRPPKPRAPGLSEGLGRPRPMTNETMPCSRLRQGGALTMVFSQDKSMSKRLSNCIFRIGTCPRSSHTHTHPGIFGRSHTKKRAVRRPRPDCRDGVDLAVNWLCWQSPSPLRRWRSNLEEQCFRVVRESLRRKGARNFPRRRMSCLLLVPAHVTRPASDGQEAVPRGSRKTATEGGAPSFGALPAHASTSTHELTRAPHQASRSSEADKQKRNRRQRRQASKTSCQIRVRHRIRMGRGGLTREAPEHTRSPARSVDVFPAPGAGMGGGPGGACCRGAIESLRRQRPLEVPVVRPNGMRPVILHGRLSACGRATCWLSCATRSRDLAKAAAPSLRVDSLGTE